MSVDMENHEFKSPLRKLVRFFRTSRDAWKRKYQDLKRFCKKQANQTAAVERSRDHWRQQTLELRQTLKDFKRELERQKIGMANLRQSYAHRPPTHFGITIRPATAIATG